MSMADAPSSAPQNGGFSLSYDDDGFGNDFFLSPEEAEDVFRPSSSFPATPCRPKTEIEWDQKQLPSNEPKLSEEQQQLVNLILSGKNVFFTGSAGTGKSTVLKAAVRELHRKGLQVDIVAPTGRSALQIGGRSTWSYMGWTPNHDKLKMPSLIASANRKSVYRRLNKTKVLVIDEVSMIENNHFERMSRCMAAARGRHTGDEAKPFGGVQLIVTGDFCQLPPVKPFAHCVECGRKTTSDERETEFFCPSGEHGPFSEHDKWAFRSAAWEACQMVHVQLRQVHRQSDRVFIDILQSCRLGLPLTSDQAELLLDHPCNVDKATRLYPTRGLCNGSQGIICGWEYRTLESLPKLRNGDLGRKKNFVGAATHTALGTEDIRAQVKEGEQPMLDVAYSRLGGNILEDDYAELKERQIEAFAKAQDHGTHHRNNRFPPHRDVNGVPEKLLPFWPRVLFHNGVKRTIFAECIVNAIGDSAPYCLLHRTQVPLAPAWAMSIHKSQGMTLDRVIVDLSRAFEEGQVYVALSRATSLEGLRVDGNPAGLSVGQGGNIDVQHFFKMKFGDISNNCV
ncbi:Pfam:DUF889 [Geosmithia morbida]|uniref:ATP-dependent DNA helicase n=1 Tax=Geosmithia morbida TaxID=1094350 RepID=A0A9P5D360_9HYPO|nr:Pfam:DUF889 [Geosmithia morbida]KAF4122206.1 Pfam:DUF889 [Geosmithia morbida]